MNLPIGGQPPRPYDLMAAIEASLRAAANKVCRRPGGRPRK